MLNAAIGIVIFLAAISGCLGIAVYHLDMIYLEHYKSVESSDGDDARTARRKVIAGWLANNNWPIHHPDIELSLTLSSLVFVGIFIGVAIMKLHK